MDKRLLDDGLAVSPNAGDDNVNGTDRDRAHRSATPYKGLGRRALALRGVHISIAILEIASVAHVWVCAITGRRDKALISAVLVLSIEGAALVATGGDCPLAPVQARLGDPTPLFELALSPTAARRAVPVLAAVTSIGVGILVARGPASTRADKRDPSGRHRRSRRARLAPAGSR